MRLLLIFLVVALLAGRVLAEPIAPAGERGAQSSEDGVIDGPEHPPSQSRPAGPACPPPPLGKLTLPPRNQFG